MTMDILKGWRWCIWVALLVTHALLFLPMASAFEPSENDDFYLSMGSSNIEVRDSDDLLSGTNVSAGLRIGLFSTFFIEFGWGNIAYSDQVTVNGVTEAIDFTTIGPHIGLGFLIPIRSFQIGARAQAARGNKWTEERTDVATGTNIDRKSGDINFDTYFLFTRLGEKGLFEIGVRRDRIRTTNSVLTNSFGPYIMLNISLD